MLCRSTTVVYPMASNRNKIQFAPSDHYGKGKTQPEFKPGDLLTHLARFVFREEIDRKIYENQKGKQMKTRTRKVLSLMLSFALLLSSVSGITFTTASAAETAKKIIVYVAAEGTNASGASVTVEKTPVLLDEGSTAVDAIRPVLDATYPEDYVISTSEWGDLLEAIGEVEQTADWSAYWNFCVNGEMASLGISSYVLQDQDQISLIYGGYPLPVSECSSYANDTSLAPDQAAQAVLLENAKAQQALLAQKIYENNLQNGAYVPGIEDTSGLYVVFSLAQAGFQADAYYDAVVNKINAQFTAIKNNGSTYGTVYDADITYDYLDSNAYAISNYCKIALCLSALGQDITDVSGINLVEKITDKNVYDAATNDTTLSRDTLILFTMDGIQANWPTSETSIKKADLINRVLDDVETQIATSFVWSSFDSAAMIIQALAPYTETSVEGVDQAAVSAACNQVIGLLSNIQNPDGTYVSYGASNPWTLAQAMITTGLFQINPLSDTRFIKNGKTLFDISATFVDTENETVDTQLIGGEYAFQPEQLLRGLNACIRTADGQKGLYDMTEPTYTAKVSATQQIINSKMVAPIADQIYTGKEITPTVTITADQKKLVEGTDYTVSYINNTEIGTAYAIITGKGTWANTSIKVAFQIVEKKQTLDNNTNNDKNTGGNQTVSKNTPTPAPTGTQPKQSTSKLTKPVIKKLTSAKKKTLTVAFKKVKNAKKYKIQISTNKKFTKNVKTKTVTSVKKVTFKKLKSGKKYYVRICAIKGKQKSKWSKVKSKKVK